ncbi:hypothetical protein P154DRAFT_600646 [Amniculicola lignicola CBS 123094]|uniref:Aminoglycoside phosphotransferase domain-containing protein n=1 Tax=Amniculicola lignicola CBS 123094 TaxID=1392246 RepID=A0A6A5WZL7_9PLEO|nr:hypothetical protein P154DRAFT_600646 [Amniculicola lignicola CBS 123094]
MKPSKGSQGLLSNNKDKRVDWSYISAISHDAFKTLVLQQLHLRKTRNGIDNLHILEETSGSYHRCITVAVRGSGEFVVRVPAISRNAWSDGDAYNLRSEVGTMGFIRDMTRVPVPKVIGWDDSGDNVIGAPFIMMEAVKGKKAADVWYDLPDGWKRGNDTSDEDEEFSADFPPPELERRRQNILRSLASLLADLSKIKFDSIGQLNFDQDSSKPPVGRSYYWDDYSDELRERPALDSSSQYWDRKLQDAYSIVDRNFQNPHLAKGIKIFLSSIVKSPSVPRSKGLDQNKETFVLTHPDLDIQNIFVDENGYVVGIIDWDQTTTVPHCIGPTAFPLFLCSDWHHEYKLEVATHMPWALKNYRNSYATYMNEAMASKVATLLNKAVDQSCDDEEYMHRLHLIQEAARNMDYDSWTLTNFIRMVFVETEVLRPFDWEEFLKTLGREGRRDGMLLLNTIL